MFLRRIMFFATLVTTLTLMSSQLVEASDFCSALSKRFTKESNDDSRPEICFEEQLCGVGGVYASTFWKNSDNPDHIKNELNEYTDWVGWITEVAIPYKSESIVQISRRVGTASCVRDSYLHKLHGKYQLIESPSLDELSAEAGHCASDFVKLVPGPKGAVVVVREGRALHAYEITPPAFALQKICTKNSAFRGKP